MRSYLQRLARNTSRGDENDAITPCPKGPTAPFTSSDDMAHQQPSVVTLHNARFTPVGMSAMSSRRGSAHSNSSGSSGSQHFDPANGENLDDQSLWLRMLAIQQKFHCYNSARMDAAIEAMEDGEDASEAIPSRTCLDLLNDSMSSMPPEIRQELQHYLARGTKRHSWPHHH